MMIKEVSLADQVAEVHREVEMRRRTYIRMIDQGKMTPEEAERRTLTMMAVQATLEDLRQRELINEHSDRVRRDSEQRGGEISPGL